MSKSNEKERLRKSKVIPNKYKEDYLRRIEKLEKEIEETKNANNSIIFDNLYSNLDRNITLISS